MDLRLRQTPGAEAPMDVVKVTAQLKLRPFKKRARSEFFRGLWKSGPSRSCWVTCRLMILVITKVRNEGP